MPLKTDLSPLHRATPWLLVLAGCLAAAINLHPIHLYLGVSLILGMSVALATLLFAGGLWGVVIAIPASLATVHLWGQPYSGSIFILEAIVLSLCRSSRYGQLMLQKGYIIIADFVFWIVLGAPLYYYTHVHFMGLEEADALPIAEKAILNGVINILIAYFVFSGLTLLRNRRMKGRATISVQALSLSTLYSLIIFIALLTTTRLNNQLTSIQAAEVANTFTRQSSHVLELLDSSSPSIERANMISLMNSLGTDFIWQTTEGNTASLSSNRYRWEALQKAYSDATESIQISKEAALLAKHPNSISLWEPTETSEKMLLKRHAGSYWVARIHSPDQRESITLVRPSRPEFRVLTTFYRSMLEAMTFVLFIGMVLSIAISFGFAREFNSVLKGSKTKNDTSPTSNNSNTLNLSPVQEIDNLALEVNQRTALIEESKREIEELNNIAQQQLSTAGEIQQCFLAKRKTGDGQPDVSLFMRPAYNAGGDWYDVFDIDGRTFIVVADVCDKGVGAALFMSVFRSLIHYASQSFCSQLEDGVIALDKVISSVNTYMSKEHGESSMFATVFLACIDQESQRLDYVLAGHEEPILLLGTGDLYPFKLCGPAIGLFPFSTYTVNSTFYDQGSILLGYTDGVTDARDAENTSFGHSRLTKLIHRLRQLNHNLTAEDLVNTLVQELDSHMGNAEQFDDITIAAAIL